jgi:hypothetical protein
MDTSASHLVYAEADDVHEMACDCRCACENLHLTPGSNDHYAHLTDCATVELCEMHVDESAVRIANALHLHLD